ncbi:MAG: helix-turn-helix transcriptional regulator, partial [Gemmatimonadota bacterium]
MSDKITKLQRWLDLIAYLLGRRYPVTVEEIMEGVPAYAEKWKTEAARPRATVHRQFERDKDELREFGIPIEHRRLDVRGGETIDAYRLARRDFYLPYLQLVSESLPEPAPRADPSSVPEIEIASEDARAALDALRRVAQVPSFPFEREARSAFRKLAFDIDPAHYAGETPVLYAEPPGAAEIADKVKTLSEALLSRKRVRFRYHGIYRGEATDRDVAPYGRAFTRGHWYLVGHDALRDALRVFRVGRMETPRVNAKRPQTADYEIPRDFRLEEHVGKEPWELGDAEDDALRAEVLFEFPSS